MIGRGLWGRGRWRRWRTGVPAPDPVWVEAGVRLHVAHWLRVRDARRDRALAAEERAACRARPRRVGREAGAR